MTNVAPILSYAAPAKAAALEAGEGDLSVTFAAPPRALELLVNGVGALLCAGVIAAALYLAWVLHFVEAALLAAVVVFVMGAMLWRRVASIGRLLTYGNLPVRLTIAGGELIVADPPEWGLCVRAWDVRTIVRCRAEFAGWSFGTRLYNINIVRTVLETIEVRIAADNQDVLRRQLADLEAKLQTAQAAQMPRDETPAANEPCESSS